MNGDTSPSRRCWLLLPLSAAILLSLFIVGCGSPSPLDPAGERATHAAILWWILLAAGMAIYLLVIALLVVALVRRGGENRNGRDLASSGRWIVGGGFVLPVLVLTPIFTATALFMRHDAIDPDGDYALEVDVIGHQWFWDVRYPSQGFHTANEIHVPAGQKVLVKLESADVAHSFWVPELSGKMDLLPGRTNYLWIKADHAGVYRGQCAEYCGLQHANMSLLVVVHTADDFTRWVDAQKSPAAEPSDERTREGQQVFLGSSCGYCHNINGINASGRIGPDLTHLGSRGYLAAGTIPNTPGAVAAWILDPQAQKPGAEMPGTTMDPEALQALLAYLESLK